jgi:hypothetical protein
MPTEGGEIQTHRESSPSEIRTALMNKFQTNLDVLHPKILESRSKEGSPRQRPLVTVVVSLWEEDETLFTSKMFSQALLNLRSQADTSGMDLDFVIVANNGGGKTEELGSKMVSNLEESLKASFGEDNYHRTNTTSPDQPNNPSIPWKAEVPLSAVRTEGKDRCFLVAQAFDKLNEGKVRALRDVSHSLYDEILKGYVPDAIFQMDAETILEYKPTHLTLIKQPFRAMYDALKRRDGVVAIGTKDRLEVMDPETGKPLGIPRPIAQEGMTQINTGKRENFISLPGGAILAEPDYYIAGMKAITEVTYGGITEDYMLTQILRAYGKSKNIPETVKINSLNVITHLNRAPQGEASIEQLLRWKEQGNAVDQIFPEFKYQYQPLYEYMIKLARSRLKASGGSKRKFLSQLIKDAKSIPGMVKLARTEKIRDPLSSESSWGHSDKK